MNEITDDRVRFHLQHEEQIDTWAALAAEASNAANRSLRSMTVDIEALALEIGEPRRAGSGVDDPAWPMTGLLMPEWIDGTGRPVVEIGLLWDRSNVTFTGRSRPSAAVRVDYGREIGQAIRQAMRVEAADVAKNHGNSGSQYWPSHRPEPPATGAYWDDPMPYRLQLLRSVRETWEHFAHTTVAAYARATSPETSGTSAPRAEPGS